MFDEMRNAINAAENVTSQFKWRKDSLMSQLDGYNSSEDELQEWEVSEKKQLATELDLLNEVEKFIMKWVKSQI